jgi:hypothetical protein
VLRVARTIADLQGAAQIDALHLAEALGYRQLDRGRADEPSTPLLASATARGSARTA